MTKLTTERLEEIANLKITEFSDGTDTASGAYQSVGSSEIVLMARQLLAYEKAAPVLPKQPEHRATKLDLATIKLWNWDAKITMGETEENCEEWIAARAILSLSDDLLALLAQPVIPEQIEPAAWRCDKEGTKGVVITVHKQVADSWILKGWKVTPLIEANQSQPVSEPYKLEIDLDDADHFSITHLQEIIYGKELIWPEAKLLARFMLDVKQRVSAAPAQESE